MFARISMGCGGSKDALQARTAPLSGPGFECPLRAAAAAAPPFQPTPPPTSLLPLLLPLPPWQLAVVAIEPGIPASGSTGTTGPPTIKACRANQPAVPGEPLEDAEERRRLQARCRCFCP